MIGRDLGRYKIVDILGSGRMGTVYKGVDELNHRQVTIKILPPEEASDPERVKRFLREARAGARLDLDSLSSPRRFEEWVLIDFGTVPVVYHWDNGQWATVETIDADQVGEVGEILSDHFSRWAW